MIRISFDNLEELKRVYDPKIVERATRSATQKLGNRVATRVAGEVTKRYKIKKSDIKAKLRKQLRYRNGGQEVLLIYRSERLSLPYFTTGGMKPNRTTRPRVKTRRGKRYGARVRVIKTRSPKIMSGAVFWGRGRRGKSEEGLGQGAWQIWKREGPSRNSIRRLTGPGVSQMVRGYKVLNAVEDYVEDMADEILRDRIEHYTARRAGVR